MQDASRFSFWADKKSIFISFLSRKSGYSFLQKQILLQKNAHNVGAHFGHKKTALEKRLLH